MTLKGVDTELLEALVRKHFGADFTSRLAWDPLRGRYVAAEQPRRLAAPQKLLGIRIGWKTVGEFSDNLGFRLEVWDPEYLARARAVAEEYNARTEGPRLRVHLCHMPWPASSQPSPA